MSSYTLGVDLGTTFTAAAIGRNSSAEPLTLGTDSAQTPSVVLIREDGEVLVGDAAERRSFAEPLRTAREFKRRLGDPVPIVIGDQPQSVESLMAKLLADVVRRATEQEGSAPNVVVLTHPANYSDYKTGLLRSAAELAGLASDQVILITEPEAAAIAYSRQAAIETGEIVAVYDFGGGTFDAALVRRTPERFELIGVPEGMERLGGIDFDQAVMAHVDSTLDGLVSAADRNDPLTRPAQARLRADCRRAKEALSTDSDTTIAVAVPGVQTEVRLTRDEFESMVRPRVAETVRALERAVASAGVGIDDISRVLLVGGTSRMPIVAETLRAATGRPVALDAHPKLAIAVGAALAGTSSLVSDAQPVVAAAAWQTPAKVAPTPTPASAPAPKGLSKGLKFAIAGLAIGGAAVVAALLLGGGSDGEKASSTTSATSSSPVSEATSPSTTAAATTVVTTLVTTVPPVTGGRGVDAIVTSVALGDPPIADIRALALDQQGALYVAGADGVIARSEDDTASIVVTDPSIGTPGGIAIAADGSVLISTAEGVRQITDGTSTIVLDAAASGLGSTPGPIVLDGLGNLYLADNDTHRIIRFGSDGSLSLVAGSGEAGTAGPPTGDGQPAGTVAIGVVTGLGIDASGNLVFADATSLAVRRVALDGTLDTIAGGGSSPLSDGAGGWVADGTSATDLGFATLDALTVDGSQQIYVTDSASGAIVRIGSDGTVLIVVARQDGVDPVDGVAARDSSITSPGSIVADRAGNLYFEDGSAVRMLAGL